MPFDDRTVTNDVSEEGCRFDLLRPLRCGDVVTLRVVGRDSNDVNYGPALRFEVVWVETSEQGLVIRRDQAAAGKSLAHDLSQEQEFARASLERIPARSKFHNAAFGSIEYAGAAFPYSTAMLDCACGRNFRRCVELRALCDDSP